MDLNKYLGLEHFLFIFQRAYFQKLKKLSSIFKNVDHKTMEGSDYRYEQVALMARDELVFTSHITRKPQQFIVGRNCDFPTK